MESEQVLALVKHYTEGNDKEFRKIALTVAKEFEAVGDKEKSDYIVDSLLKGQTQRYMDPKWRQLPRFRFLEKLESRVRSKVVYPNILESDLQSVIRLVRRHQVDINRILFHGWAGMGKTEAVKRIAAETGRGLYQVKMELVFDSHVGQTNRNLEELCEELCLLPSPGESIILFEDLDTLHSRPFFRATVDELDRIVESILKCLRRLPPEVIVFVTFNYENVLERDLLRYFDVVLDFNVYDSIDLLNAGEAIFDDLIGKFSLAKPNKRIYKRILKQFEPPLRPGVLKVLLRSILTFTKYEDGYAYLRPLLYLTCTDLEARDRVYLMTLGFSPKEAEILLGDSE